MVEELAGPAGGRVPGKNCKVFLQAGIYKVVTCKLKPLKEGQTERVRETPDPVTLYELETLPAEFRARAWFEPAVAAVKAGKAVRYGEDSKALEALVVAAYKGQPAAQRPDRSAAPRAASRPNRDTLVGSGSDALLELYGESTNNVKLLAHVRARAAPGHRRSDQPKVQRAGRDAAHELRRAKRPEHAAMKTCKGCGLDKAETDFSTNRANKDELEKRCKACMRQWRLDHPATKEKRKERCLKWRGSVEGGFGSSSII
jgi:hypothetical protein